MRAEDERHTLLRLLFRHHVLPFFFRGCVSVAPFWRPCGKFFTTAASFAGLREAPPLRPIAAKYSRTASSGFFVGTAGH